MNNLATLQVLIGYSFKDTELLKRALTHKSLNNKHYEKLEFLGDSVLDLVISTYIFNKYENFCEGSLSMLRANIVNKSALCQVAQAMNLEGYILCAPFQKKSPTILADVVEAIAAAIYLDGGLDATTQFIIKHFSQIFANTQNHSLKDSKTALQELTLAKRKSYPVYTIVKISGEQHNKCYTIECTALDQSARAEGKSKRQGEQKAAQQVLDQITQLEEVNG